MGDAKYERAAAWGGVAGIVCFVASAVISGVNIGAHDQFKPAVVAKAYTDSHNGIRAAPFIFALGFILVLWWFGTLWRMMSRAEGGEPRLAVMAGLGLVSAGTLQLLHLTMNSAIAWRPLDLGSSIVTMVGMANAVASASAVGLVAFLAGVSALAIRTRFLPAWLAWGGAVIGAIWLVSTLAVSTFNGIGALGALAYLLWVIWILGISWTMWRASRKTTIATAP